MDGLWRTVDPTSNLLKVTKRASVYSVFEELNGAGGGKLAGLHGQPQ